MENYSLDASELLQKLRGMLGIRDSRSNENAPTNCRSCILLLVLRKTYTKACGLGLPRAVEAFT